MRDDTKSKDFRYTPSSGGKNGGGTTHHPKGAMKASRSTTLMTVHNNKLTNKKVDGEVKSHPQPC